MRKTNSSNERDCHLPPLHHMSVAEKYPGMVELVPRTSKVCYRDPSSARKKETRTENRTSSFVGFSGFNTIAFHTAVPGTE